MDQIKRCIYTHPHIHLRTSGWNTQTMSGCVIVWQQFIHLSRSTTWHIVSLFKPGRQGFPKVFMWPPLTFHVRQISVNQTCVACNPLNQSNDPLLPVAYVFGLTLVNHILNIFFIYLFYFLTCMFLLCYPEQIVARPSALACNPWSSEIFPRYIGDLV